MAKTATVTWKISLPCTRVEAEALDGDELQEFAADNPPTIVTSEISPDQTDEWRVDVYSQTAPDDEMLDAIAKLAPATNEKPSVEKLGDEDWVTLSQQGLEPIRSGSFYIHTSDSAPLGDPAVRNLCIDASQAFGTGHHETTLGCLQMLERLKQRGKHFNKVIDVGTGTGLLAFAAQHLWPAASIIASDIDPVAVTVSRDNAAHNGFRKTGPRAIQFLVSNGLDHMTIRRKAPYDLIIANILAGPLVSLAPQIAAAAKGGATLILAGLLTTQQDDVVLAYRRAGFRLKHSEITRDWPCLIFTKAKSYGRPRRQRILRSPLASDYFGEC